MNFIRYSSVLALSGVLFACGGSQKPTVDAAPATVPAAAPTQQKVNLDDVTSRYSYALGMDLGKAIANINVPVNMVVLMEAIKDQVDSTRPVLMSDTVAEKALQDLLLQMQQKKEADEAASAKKSLDDQAAFLAKNVLDSTVKVTPKGVQYKILKDGEGISPKATEKVQVHYVGSLLDGTEFDNSVKRGEPLEFPVAAVIEGWQDLLQVMKEGMKVKAWIPSALAYGEDGVPPLIPANSLLVFDVELLKVYAEVPPADSAAVGTTTAPAENAAATKADVAPAAETKPAEAKPAADSKAAKPTKKN